MDEMVEISQSRLALLEGVAKIKEELWNDSKFGPTIKEMVKQKFPNANIPEVDMARASRNAETTILAKVEEKEKALESRIEAFEKAQKERDEKDSNAKEEMAFTREVESVKKKYQLSSEGMEKVFSRMKEKNNPDVESAAAWVTDHEVKEAPPAASPYSPQSLDLYGSKSGDKAWEELNRDPLAYGDAEIARMANDFSNGNFGKYKEFGGSL